MYVKDFSFSKDDNGVEYITYEENPTKTHHWPSQKNKSGSAENVCNWLAKMSSHASEDVSVTHRPEEMKTSGPFYLAMIERTKSQVWYKRQRIGIHRPSEVKFCEFLFLCP